MMVCTYTDTDTHTHTHTHTQTQHKKQKWKKREMTPDLFYIAVPIQYYTHIFILIVKLLIMKQNFS